ncbi:MAG: prepilin-type N-terminal cleavage/methylation domain-containing protein [Clostridia bacterium]
MTKRDAYRRRGDADIMQYDKPHLKGFTLLEIIVVLLILTLLMAFAVPVLLGFVNETKTNLCQATRRDMQRLYRTSVLGKEAIISNIDFELFAQKNWSNEKQCPARGVYTYIASLENGNIIMTEISCSEHGVLKGSAMSPLGNNFQEIAPAMIIAIQQRFSSKGSYGRNWGDYAYTDIGLNPADWSTPIDHIYYKPGGATLSIRPEAGYAFLVEDYVGGSRKMPASYNWNITYNDLDKNWYFHTIDPSNIINITTLKVVK